MVKKILVGLVAIWLLGITSAFAGVKEAKDLYNQKKYVEAEAEFVKVLPTLKEYQKAEVQRLIGRCLHNQKKYAEAIIEFKKMLTIEDTSGYQKGDANLYIGFCLHNQKKPDEATAEYRKVLTIEDATISHISWVLNNTKDISGMEETFILQLKTQPRNEKTQKDIDVIIKKASTNTKVCRAVISAMPEDVEVVSALLPNIGKVELKEKAVLLTDIWEANVDKISSDAEAKLLVDGVVTSLTQLLGLGTNPSIIEARNKIAEMK